MNTLGRILAAAIVLVPGSCSATILWSFEDNSMPPNDLLNSSAGGSWSIGPSQSEVGSGNVIRAELESSVSSGSGTGSGVDEEPPVYIDTYSPEFRFQDIRAALLDFNFDIDSENCSPGNCVESLLVTLHKTVNHLPVDEKFLFQFFTFDVPPVDLTPIPIVPTGGSPPAGHMDGLTTYRIRLRVHDGDQNKHTLVGAEVDDLSLTSAISNVPGDYNSNFVVDAADYTVWRNTLETVGTVLVADGDRDGRVDLGDYGYWKSRFGGSGAGFGSRVVLPASVGPAVPEPQPLILSLAALVTGVALRPRARR